MKKAFLIFAIATGVFAGEFDGTYSTKKGDIKVMQFEGIVNFMLLSVGSGSMSSACDVSGSAVMQSKTAALFQRTSDTGGCAILFDFSQSGKLLVKSKGCQMFCTDRSGFDGEYKKTK